MRIVRQSNTSRKLVFLLVQSSDHITGLTGALSAGLTVTISKNGAGFAAPTGTVAEVGNGFYALTPSSADTATLGSLVLHATATGADPCDVEFEVVAFDPQDSVRLGQTALPNVAAGGLNGLPLSADTSGRVDVLKINGTSQTARDIGASVLLSSGTGTGQVNLSLGRVGINWGDVANQSSVVNLTNTTVANVSGSVGSVTGTVTANTTQLAGQTVTAASGVTFPSSVSSLTAANVWQTDVSAYATTGQAGTYQKNADALTSSRMATFTLPTNFSSLAITAGGAVTAGTVSDKTGYSLTQAFPTNFSSLAITAGGVVTANTTQLAGQTVTAAAGVTFPASVSSLTAPNVWDYSVSAYTTAGQAGTYMKNVDALVSSRMATFTLPTNFSSLAITAGGAVTAGTVSDKTGYSLTQAFPANFSSMAITAGGVVTANTTQLAGQSVTAAAGVTFPSTVSSLTSQNVWDHNVSAYVSAGLAGTYLKSAASAGDPWSTALPGAYAAGTAGYIVGTNIDATITSRQATVTFPTNFSSLAITAGGAVTAGTVNDKTGYSLSNSQTFSTTGSVGSVTGSVGSVTGSVASVTGSVGSVAGDVSGKVLGGGASTITGDGVRAASVTGNVNGSVNSVVSPVTVGTNNDKTGYSLTQAFPANFSSLAITVGGAVTAGTISDKTGYTLANSQTFSTTGSVGSVTGSVASVTGSVGSVTGNVAGSVNSVVTRVTANTDQLAGQSVSAASGVTFPASVSSLTAANVWQSDISGYVTAGYAGTYLKGAGAAGDPWSSVLPGAYAAGTAGYLLGTNLDATVSSRSTLTAANVWQTDISGYTTPGYSGTYLKGVGSAADPWATSLPGAYSAGTAGYIIGNNLNATVGSRMATFTLPTNFSSLAITGGGAVTAGTVSDKTGYSLSQSFPANFASLAITAGGAVTAGTVSDKTGYSLTQAFPTNFSALAITPGGAVTAGTVSDKTGYALSSSQTFSTTGSVGSVSGDVTGKVLGNGASSIVGDGVRAVSVTGNVGGNVVGSVGSVASAVTVGSINANAITAASIATDAIDADALAASAVSEIQSGLSTLSANNVADAVWKANRDVDSTTNSWGNDTMGHRILKADTAQAYVAVTGSHHIAADIHELQPAVINSTHFAAGAVDANALATDAVAEITDGVWDEIRGGARPAGSFGAYLDGSISGVQSTANTINTTVNTINNNTDGVETVTNKLNTMLVQVGAGPNWQYTANALAFAPGGTGDANNYVPVTLPFGTNVRHTLTFNAGATLPIREDILQQQDRTPLDLSSATSVVYELMPVDSATPAVYASATIVDEPGGRVRYTWQSGDLDTVNTYRERWIVTYPSGQVSVFGPLIKVA